jgi:hypothetical protein
MSIKTRAALRLAAHLAISVTAGAAIYAAITHLTPTTLMTVAGLAGVIFFGYQVFQMYVAVEQIKENNQK